jgi:ubiquinone/menaquinone biosynthesis C-methylase UbiE
VRHIPPWQNYDRMAASGEYGTPATEVCEAMPSEDLEAAFFQRALDGRRCVLDLGCGPGVPLLSLAHRVGRIFGLDASPAMLTIARQSIAALGLPNASLVRGLAEALPFAAGRFDGVAVSGTLCSVPDPDPVIAEVARVTGPGAVVAVLVWEFGRVFAEREQKVDRSLRRDGGDLALHVIRYLAHPYRIRHERYLLDTRHELVRALLDDPELSSSGRKATDLRPEEIPPAMVRDATCEEEAQFDPETLEAAFARHGFGTAELRVEMSFETPHIFGVFRRD